MPRIEKACMAHGVDAKLLITEVSKVDKINPSETLIDQIAARCAAAQRQGLLSANPALGSGSRRTGSTTAPRWWRRRGNAIPA